MTKKRFILNKGVANFSDTVTDKIYSEYNLDEIVELLNELNDENIELHIQNDFLKDENQHMRTVLKENKELKSLCKTLITQIEKNRIAFVIDENIRGLLE